MRSVQWIAIVLAMAVSALCGLAYETNTGACLKVGKYYDCDLNRVWDVENEPPIAEWQFKLTGILCDGSTYGPSIKATNEDGIVTWYGLPPGKYTVCEIFPSADWISTGPVSRCFDLKDGYKKRICFGNIKVKCADFDTKGYWHNKNGLEEITAEDLVYLNSLAPFSAPSDYFGAGDEPFDGVFANGDPVAEAFPNFPLAGEGTALAEISHFLVDPIAGSNLEEQLAQQLLAFILNARHRLPSADTPLLIGTQFVTAQEIIDAAIAAWLGDPGFDAARLQLILDRLNNSDCVKYPDPCGCEENDPE